MFWSSKKSPPGLSFRDRSMDMTLCKVSSKHPCGSQFRVVKNGKYIYTTVCGYTVEGQNLIILSQRRKRIYRTTLDKNGVAIV